MADDAIKIDVSGNVKAGIAKSIRDIGDAALYSDKAVDALKAALANFSAVNAFKSAANDAKNLSGAIKQATGAQNAFSAANSNTTKTLVSATKAANGYSASLNNINGANVNLGRTTGALRSSLGGLAAAFGGIFALRGYVQAQDALTSVQNQIRTITNGTAEAAALQEKLFALANRTRTGIESTTTAYTNFYKQLSALGAGEAEVLRIVETLNKGFIVGGKSAAEAAGSVRQFVQGLQNGALRGEEFNSVMEGFPKEIIDAFAKTLGVSTLQLRKMAEQGKITADVIRESMGSAAGTVDELFARLTPTISSAITVLNNKFIEFTSNTSGLAAALAQTILIIGDNLNLGKVPRVSSN